MRGKHPDFHGLRSKSRQEQKALKEPIDEQYRAVFNTPAGQAILFDLHKVANGTKVDGNNPDPNAAVYKEGQRALVAYIIKKLEVNK